LADIQLHFASVQSWHWLDNMQIIYSTYHTGFSVCGDVAPPAVTTPITISTLSAYSGEPRSAGSPQFSFSTSSRREFSRISGKNQVEQQQQ